jgi:predicted methyltransferase
MNPEESQLPPRPTTLARTLMREVIQPGDTVIDATAGNGHDTLFLAECVGPHGSVLAFDIQENATIAAGERLDQAGLASRVRLYQTSHVHMASHADADSVSAVMFNLGYLPGDDHLLTTEAAATLEALNIATSLLKPGGTLTIVCYPGHAEGATEAAAVETWITTLAPRGWRIARYSLLGTARPAPFLLVASKYPRERGRPRRPGE